MKQTDSPDKLVLPFADAGAKNPIPAASQIGITAGAASLTDGFPPLTRTPIAAGGVPPSGLDMNGVLYLLSAVVRWACSGGGFAYDSAFATDTNVDGYPKGARVMRSDGLGYWINTTDDNTTDPEGAGAVAAGWVPDFTSGATAIAMTSANVTLAPLQYGKPIVLITGTLTADLNLVFPNIADQWVVVNGTTGAYTITAKTAAGTGVTCVQSGATYIYGDGTNIASLSAQSIPNASTTVAGIVELATSAETIAGLSGTLAVTPAGLAAVLATLTTWPGVYAGSDANNVTFPIGTCLFIVDIEYASHARNSAQAVYLTAGDNYTFTTASGGSALAGTWRARGGYSSNTIYTRTA